MSRPDPKQLAQNGATDGQALLWSDSLGAYAPSSPPAPPPSDSGSAVPRAVLDSRGGGLLTNGTGLMGYGKAPYLGTDYDVLYNFKPASPSSLLRVSKLTDGNLLDGVGAGITVDGSTFFGTESVNFNNEIMAISPSLAYHGTISAIPNAAAAANSRRFYAGHTFVDQSGRSITSSHHQHRGLAKLAQDLVLGTDTWMYIVRDSDFLGAVDPHIEWGIGTNDSTYALRRGPIFWDHHFPAQQTNPDGTSKPFSRVNETGIASQPAGFGYSRHYIYDLWNPTAGLWELANDGSGAGNWNGYTNVWRHPIKTAHGTHYGHTYSPNATATLVPEGTWLSGNYHGGTYKYCYAAGTQLIDSEKFYRFEGWIGGIDYSGNNRAYNFPPGAAGVVWMMLTAYAGAVGEKHFISAMGMSEDSGVRLANIQVGAIPEHVYALVRKIEPSGAAAPVVTTMYGPRFTTARKYTT